MPGSARSIQATRTLKSLFRNAIDTGTTHIPSPSFSINSPWMPYGQYRNVMNLAGFFAIAPASDRFALVGFQAAPVRVLRPARGNV